MEDNDNFSPIHNFHHIKFYVSNALQASFWYCLNFGFKRFSHRRTKHSTEITIRNGKVVFVFKNSILPNDPEGIGKEIAIHGDFVKDVAYAVDNLDFVLESLLQQGLHLLEQKTIITDADGSLFIAKIKGSSGSIVHTLIQNIDYNGIFMPGFKSIQNYSFCETLDPILYCGIDHVVEAHPEHSLNDVINWYEIILRMHRFWSIDDKLVHAEFSALRAVLVENKLKNVKITLVEPVLLKHSKRRGQVQEFLDFHGESGIQHIALLTGNIVEAVQKLRDRGVEFLDIPLSYYNLLKDRLDGIELSFKLQITEQFEKIRELGILMDFDKNGYLLQIFTKPVQERATLFLEIIQRHNYNGFGAGNFQALFAAVELEQKRRDAIELDSSN